MTSTTTKPIDVHVTLRRAVEAAVADIDERLRRGERIKLLEIRRLLDLCRELELRDEFERTRVLMTGRGVEQR